MNRTTLIILAVIVIGGGVIASGTLFTVNQMAQAIVMQFGDPKQVIREPGLNVKIPFIQDAVYYDKRTLDLDPPAEQVILADKKRINVDSYARYRIVDPLQFFQAVRTEARFRDRFGKILNSSVRNVLARYPLNSVLSGKREEIMANIKSSVSAAAPNFGIEVIDVRIGRADLPEDISKNVFDRMRSEREREANLLRAEGDELKQKLTADADRQKTVILAEANKQSQILRGEGDAKKNQILGDAYGQGPEFFAFIRSMEAYRKALGPEGTTMVLSPDSDFFRFFSDLTGRGNVKK
jgi:membrane protease subunit HflC